MFIIGNEVRIMFLIFFHVWMPGVFSLIVNSGIPFVCVICEGFYVSWEGTICPITVISGLKVARKGIPKSVELPPRFAIKKFI